MNTQPVEMSDFAKTITQHKYAQTLSPQAAASLGLSGNKEEWPNIAYRVTKNVMKAAGLTMRDKTSQSICRLITERKFMPGGRYLYASGRPFHQTQNCLLLRVHDSREGWAELLHNAGMALMTGAGIGVDYSDLRHEGAKIRRTGGEATGPIALMQMLNECGRGIMQGGSRRSAIWAGLKWSHPDIHKFIRIKNWSPEVVAIKEKDFNFPATLDCTNISVILDDDFFEAYRDEEHTNHALAHSVYWATIEQMLKTAEPGFSVDTGKNGGETLRNAPVAGDTWVLTDKGYAQVQDIIGIPTRLWTGYRYAVGTFQCTKRDTDTVEVNINGVRKIVCDPSHEFFIRKYKGAGSKRTCQLVKVPAQDLKPDDYLDVGLPSVEPIKSLNNQSWSNGFLLGDGSGREVTLCTEEKKALAPLLTNVRSSTLNDRRGYDRHYLSQTIVKDALDTGDCVQSFIAGWFDADGSYDAQYQRVRLSGEYSLLVKARRLLESVGIVANISKPIASGYGGSQDTRNLIVMTGYVPLFASIIPCQRLKIKADGYKPYRPSELRVLSVTEGTQQDVYCCDVGVEEHSFVSEGVRISNCTEVTSRDNNDICNLGSINLARIETKEEFTECVEKGIAFLLAGTLYSDVPYQDVDRTRTKNRRLGLGLMGIHEWLLKRGKPYGPDKELGEWLEIYKRATKIAHRISDEWEISRPKKTRAIAPTGTISITAETTGGIEPIFCVAYKRRYLKHKTWHYQYVIDPTAKRLISGGVDPHSIEDAYTLAQNVNRRVEFQAWIQKYVDHGISSTINLTSWGSQHNNAETVRPFGEMLIEHLPNLRGITCYPDGARGGQPLTPVAYSTAVKHEGTEVVEEPTLACVISKGGDCGD